MNYFILEFQKKLKRSPKGLIGFSILLLWILISFCAPLVAPFDFSELNVENILVSPNSTYLFGTDHLGRDIFSRIIYGSRSILLIGLMTSILATSLGTIIGFLSAYFGGWLDEIIMRFMDILMSIPALLLAMVFLGIFQDAGMFALTTIIAIVFTPRTARVARAAFLEWKGMEFVQAAKISGDTISYIIFREIMPNTFGSIIVEGTARFAYTIMTVASLGFLGIGLQPPTPDWGMVIAENKTNMSVAPWTVLFPSLAIGSLVLGISLAADFLNKVLVNE